MARLHDLRLPLLQKRNLGVARGGTLSLSFGLLASPVQFRFDFTFPQARGPTGPGPLADFPAGSSTRPRPARCPASASGGLRLA